jgi:hypothetical protein
MIGLMEDSITNDAHIPNVGDPFYQAWNKWIILA